MFIGLLRTALPLCLRTLCTGCSPRARCTWKRSPQHASSSFFRKCAAWSTHMRARRGLQAPCRPLRSAGSALTSEHCRFQQRETKTSLEGQSWSTSRWLLRSRRESGRANGRYAQREAPKGRLHCPGVYVVTLDIHRQHVSGSEEPMSALFHRGENVPVTTPAVTTPRFASNGISK